MSTTTYVTRREQQITFARNHNTVRHAKRNLGSISQAIIVSMLVMIFGLIYVAVGTKATSFDYELSAVEAEIYDMTAKKEDLAVEKARLTSIAAAKNNAVAAVMETATVSGYAAE